VHTAATQRAENRLDVLIESLDAAESDEGITDNMLVEIYVDQ
jgi:hypothetical protein